MDKYIKRYATEKNAFNINSQIQYKEILPQLKCKGQQIFEMNNFELIKQQIKNQNQKISIPLIKYLSKVSMQRLTNYKIFQIFQILKLANIKITDKSLKAINEYYQYFKQFQFQIKQPKFQRFQKYNISILKSHIYHRQISIHHPLITIKSIKSDAHIIIYSIIIGIFQITVTMLNINDNSHNQAGFCSGGYGEVRFEKYSNENVAIKKIKFISPIKFLNNKYGIRVNKKQIEAILVQYAIYKLASLYQIGPDLKSSHQNQIDLICYNDCIQFAMEKCEPIQFCDEENLRRDLKACLLKLHSINIVHKDIKTSNIMFSNKFNKYVFIDYGISSVILENIGKKSFNYFEGTISYMGSQMLSIKEKGHGYINLYKNDIQSLQISLKQNKQLPPIANKTKLNKTHGLSLESTFKQVICQFKKNINQNNKNEQVINKSFNYLRIFGFNNKSYQLLQQLSNDLYKPLANYIKNQLDSDRVKVIPYFQKYLQQYHRGNIEKIKFNLKKRIQEDYKKNNCNYFSILHSISLLITHIQQYEQKRCLIEKYCMHYQKQFKNNISVQQHGKIKSYIELEKFILSLQQKLVKCYNDKQNSEKQQDIQQYQVSQSTIQNIQDKKDEQLLLNNLYIEFQQKYINQVNCIYLMLLQLSKLLFLLGQNNHNYLKLSLKYNQKFLYRLQKEFQIDHPIYIKIRLRLIKINIKLKSYENALKQCQKLKEILNNIFLNDSQLYADYYFYEANIYYLLRKYEKAENSAEKSLEILEQLSYLKHDKLFNINGLLYKIKTILKKQKECNKYLQNIKTQKKIINNNINLIKLMAGMESQKCNLREQLKYRFQILQYYCNTQNNQEIIKQNCKIAEIYCDLNQSEQALKIIFSNNIIYFKRYHNPQLQYKTIKLISIIYQSDSQYQRAQQYAKQAYQKAIKLDDNNKIFQCLLLLAKITFNKGEFDKVDDLLDKAESIINKDICKKRLIQINLLKIQLKIKQQYFDQALNIIEQTSQVIKAKNISINMFSDQIKYLESVVRLHQGKLNKSIECMQQWLKIISKYGEMNPINLRKYNHLIRILVMQKQFEKFKIYEYRINKIIDINKIKNIRLLNLIHLNFSQAYFIQKNYKLSLYYAKKSIQYVQDYQAHIKIISLYFHHMSKISIGIHKQVYQEIYQFILSNYFPQQNPFSTRLKNKPKNLYKELMQKKKLMIQIMPINESKAMDYLMEIKQIYGKLNHKSQYQRIQKILINKYYK